MDFTKRVIYLIIGPALFAACALGLSDVFGGPGAQAVGTLLWMVFWWVSRPVDLTVTALLPIPVNALFSIVPMADVISQYFSESIVLVFGSCLLTVPWKATGFDRRVAYKILAVVGPSLTSQLVVWFVASMLFSAVLPNIAVVSLFCPLALAMFRAAGYEGLRDCPSGPPIFLAICWGTVLGGIITPLGGAMNVTAISLLQEQLGIEVMYLDWIIRFLPYTIVTMLVFFGMMMAMFRKVEPLKGSKEFFREGYKAMGKIKADEAMVGIFFAVAFLGALCRPLFAGILPNLVPAYIFVAMGMLSFIFTYKKQPLMGWDDAQKGVMWGMMYLFAGGLAIGTLINGSGATSVIATILQGFSLDGGITTIIVFVLLACLISELTSSTVSSAVTVPLVIALTTQLGLNPIPYWCIVVMAFDAEFLLPVSIRAVPAGYGLEAGHMLKYGLPMMVARIVIIIVMGYLLMQFWPTFSVL